MTAGAGGAGRGDASEPYSIFPAQPLDQPVAKGHLTKDRREDAQLYSFLHTVSLTSGGGHPFQVAMGTDPPDRFLTDRSGQTWGLELTQLTFSDVRQDLAEARRFGRAVGDEIRTRSSKFAHLRGRRVMLSVMPVTPMPRDHTTLLNQVLGKLESDRGYFLQDTNLAHGLPDTLDGSGDYGLHGPIGIAVYFDGVPGDHLVIASAQATLRPTEARDKFRSLVSAKDQPNNDLLLISLSAPDERGYICPPDFVLYRFLTDAARDENLLLEDPKYIQDVAVHLWGTNQWIQVNTHGACSPWNGATVATLKSADRENAEDP